MSLALEQAGSGIPVVFLHAFPLSRAQWRGQEPISHHFRTLNVDLPGFGESPAGKPTMKIDETARAVMRTLDERNINQPAIFVGLSMGGYVLLQILRLFPHRVRAAVLASTRTAPDTPEGREKRMENVALVESKGVAALADKMVPSLLGESTRQGKPEVVDAVRAMIKAQSAAAVTAALRGMAERTDTTPVLSGVACPALVIAGSEDSIIKTEEMEEMAKRIPRGEFEIIEKSGHLLNIEAPEQFNDALLHFLKRRVL